MVLFPAAAGPSIAITTRRRLLLIGLNQLLKQGFRMSDLGFQPPTLATFTESPEIRNPTSEIPFYNWRMNRRAFLATAAAGSLLAASDRVRIGLIGTGSRCMTLADYLKAMPGVDIVAACAVYEPRRLAAAASLGPQAKPMLDYREVLDRNDVDAVVIATPDHWHTRMTLDAVAAGKDVYCEKPVTHTLAEGDLLLAGVESSGRVFASGTQQRSWEHYALAKQAIDSGLLGQITLAQCYWYQNRLARPSQEIDAARL